MLERVGRPAKGTRQASVLSLAIDTQGRLHLEFARTEVGAREVENLIGRLEHENPIVVIVRAWVIAKKKPADQAFSGEGARRRGGCR